MRFQILLKHRAVGEANSAMHRSSPSVEFCSIRNFLAVLFRQGCFFVGRIPKMSAAADAGFPPGVRIRWKRENGLPKDDPESTRDAEKLVQGVFELKNAQHA